MTLSADASTGWADDRCASPTCYVPIQIISIGEKSAMNIKPECLDDHPADETCLVKPHMYIDPCVEEEYQDASFCTGDSDQGYGAPMCERSERSARGFCPDDEDKHEAERLMVICSEPDNFTDECYQWRLDTYGDGYWGTNEGYYEEETIAIPAPPEAVATPLLPEAGISFLPVLILTILLSAAGTKMMLIK